MQDQDLEKIIKKVVREALEDFFPEKRQTNLMCRKEVSQFFGVHDCTIKKWAEEGKIQEIKIGGRFYYDRENILEYALPRLNKKAKGE